MVCEVNVSPMTQIDRDSTYTTRGGEHIDLLNISAAGISIADIAGALSKLCRWGGHPRRFYSIAEHSVHVSHVVSPPAARWALLHDAPEAYVHDIVRPLKRIIAPLYSPIEERFMARIAEQYDLGPFPEEVKAADNAVLEAERDQLMPPESRRDIYMSPRPQPANITVQCWLPEQAEYEFLKRFWELVT